VEPVRQPVERLVLARVVEVEDVLRNDADLADARPGRLQLGERRDALLRFAGPCQKREANGEPVPSLRDKPDRAW